jgi:hypothetical protein
MANAHYAAQMANAGPSYTTRGSNYNFNDPHVGNETYGTHAKLNHLHGPTGNPGPRSNGTLYANSTDLRVIKGVRGRDESGAVRYKSETKPVGGARKKTRKHKKSRK